MAVVGLISAENFRKFTAAIPTWEKWCCAKPTANVSKITARCFGYTECYQSYDDLLKSDVDAIHITTGIPNHHELTVKALRAGKHCACTVPMATTLEDLCDIIRVQKETGKKYMMMETTIYTFQTLYVKKLLEQGELDAFSICAAFIFRIWKAGPITGWGFRRCITPPMRFLPFCI